MTVLEVQNETLRQKASEAAKKHKASWMQLGQYLFSIHKDKLYKAWSFLSFETYCFKELGIKQTTAAKLLKSYSFLEKEEPRFLRAPIEEEESAATLPNYESVNLLRLAKENKKIQPQDFAELREAVIEKGKEPKEVRAQVQKILLQHEPKDPDKEKASRRNAAIKRLITTLSNTRRELESEGLLPAYLLKQITELSEKLQDQIEE